MDSTPDDIKLLYKVKAEMRVAVQSLLKEFQLLPKLARAQPLVDKAKLQSASSVEEALEIAHKSLQAEATV